ncbi:general odorant-binding protein 56d [Diachasma alloeum]|uniref:Odorant binding protein 4 n=1 Tax=Diachasma alloeum TaxID=454923 RepID=A0A4E0S3S6_9HYME|nr:general odorant-binding protein 56d [Diachasma alloeum]THK33045.1 odorant binding protein 4 [Diachasma alloeum]
MKFLVVLFFVCLVGALAQELNEAQRQRLREHRDACIRETGADRAEVDRAHRGDWADNPTIRCFALCMMKRLGLMSDDGKLNETAARQRLALVLRRERVEEVMRKCKDLKGPTPCDTGYLILKCYTDNRANMV